MNIRSDPACLARVGVFSGSREGSDPLGLGLALTSYLQVMEGLKELEDTYYNEEGEEEGGRMVFMGEECTVETFEGLLQMAELAVRSECALFFHSRGG